MVQLTPKKFSLQNEVVIGKREMALEIDRNQHSPNGAQMNGNNQVTCRCTLELINFSLGFFFLFFTFFSFGIALILFVGCVNVCVCTCATHTLKTQRVEEGCSDI